jgi:hypothetical protein
MCVIAGAAVDVDCCCNVVASVCNGAPVVCGEVPRADRNEFLINAPDSVNWFKCQRSVEVPGCSAAQLSALSLIAQLQSDIECCARKSNQTRVLSKSRAPFPLALQTPHSVAKMARPAFKATITLSRFC